MIWWLLLACPATDGPSDTDPVDGIFPDGAVVLAHVSVYDAEEGAREGRHVVLFDDRIHAVVSEDVSIPAAVTTVDLTDHWVVPGLIDGHVHLTLSGTMSWAGDALEENLRMTLGFGVTTVVDVGAPLTAVQLRDRVAAGELLGPDIRVMGPMVTEVGSHPCETYNDPDYCLFASTEAQGTAAGEALVEAGTDGIKLAIADADFTPWPTPRLDPAVAASAVAPVVAADADALVVAHVDEVEDVLDALDAGVNVLGHPVFGGVALTVADAGTIAAQGVPVQSTLGASAGLGDLLDGDLDVDALEPWLDPGVAANWAYLAEHPEAFDPEWIDQSALWTEELIDSLLTLREAGAVVLPASDAGYYFQPHGLGLHRELAALEELGWTAEELIDLATWQSASAYHFDDRGLVREGFRADLLVVDGDPREDLSRLAAPTWVVHGGVRSSPEQLRTAEVLLTPDSAAVGAFCLEAADCASGACDQVQHVCAEPCETAWDVTGECGADSLCLPVDGLVSTEEVACQQVDQTCTLYADDCAPAAYDEACVPGDLDTAYCAVSGPQGRGEACSWSDPTLACQSGLFCSIASYTCFELCDPAADTDTCTVGSCRPEYAEGELWFGLCW